MNLPHAAVVVCAYTTERWDDLCAALESAAAQDPAPAEICLVIDGDDALGQRARADNDIGRHRQAIEKARSEKRFEQHGLERRLAGQVAEVLPCANQLTAIASPSAQPAIGFDGAELVGLRVRAVRAREATVRPLLELGVRHREQVVLARQRPDRW